jgi:hypothetical protein
MNESPLDRLLAVLREGGLVTMDQLAGQLDVTVAMLEAMIADLVRLGYLKSLQSGCSGSCSGCSAQGACSLVGGGQTWTLTEKGSR